MWNTLWSQLWSSWHQQCWLSWKSVDHTYGSSITCMCQGASHACCTIVLPTTAVCVQNYAGIHIKRGSCWKCFSGWHMRPVCIIRTTVGQHSTNIECWVGLSLIAEPLGLKLLEGVGLCIKQTFQFLEVI